MKTKFLTPISAITAGLLLTVVSAHGHHGTFVSYDPDKRLTLKGTVTEFQFTNPHMQLYFDVTDENGNVTHWAAEGPDPAVWVAGGWGRKKSQAALAPGTKITITLNPARNGKPVGAGTRIVLEDGTVIGPAGNAQ